MRKLVSLAFLIAILFASCKKEKDPSLQGLWNIDNVTYKYYINNTLDDTDVDLSGGTLEFKSDGTAVLNYMGDTDTSSYTITGDKVSFDGDTYDIKTLTDDNATLYIKETYAPGEYDELFVNLSR
jgi:hypothetical protein